MTVDPLEVIRDLCSLRERPGDPVPLGVSVQPFKDGSISANPSFRGGDCRTRVMRIVQ